MASPITKTRVGDREREAFLPRHLGNKGWFFEQNVFNLLGLTSPDYDGGLWEFFDLSNGGFYLCPPAKQYTLKWDDNYFEGQMTEDAAGIAVTLFILGRMSFGDQPEPFSTKFHLLREFALDHKEASAIFGFID